MEEFSNKKPPTPLLIFFDPEEVRKQAAASTLRFEEGIATFSTYKLMYVCSYSSWQLSLCISMVHDHMYFLPRVKPLLLISSRMVGLSRKSIVNLGWDLHGN